MTSETFVLLKLTSSAVADSIANDMMLCIVPIDRHLCHVCLLPEVRRTLHPAPCNPTLWPPCSATRVRTHMHAALAMADPATMMLLCPAAVSQARVRSCANLPHQGHIASLHVCGRKDDCVVVRSRALRPIWKVGSVRGSLLLSHLLLLMRMPALAVAQKWQA